MKSFPALLLSLVLTVSLGVRTRSVRAGEPAPRFAHTVFFELNEDTEAAKKKLVAACRKYLSRHKGTVRFQVGVIAEDMKRDVNDRSFHVALFLVFKDKAAHDLYQKSPRHLQFIKECKESWKNVRVFDAYLAAPKLRVRRDVVSRRIPLPDPAARFAGMIHARVDSKQRGRIVVVVETVLKEWEGNKAKDSGSLVGKKVIVNVRKVDGKPAPQLVRFLKLLKVGDKVDLDVAHQKGEALTLVELTEKQREKVGKVK